MANRSDFFNAKLPRSLKRMLAMAQVYGFTKNKEEANQIRKIFIKAHANHVSFKLRRPDIQTNESDTAG